MTSPTTPSSSAPPAATPLILYVDDERPNRIVFEASFGNKFNLRSVGDGNAALEVMASQEVAIIITDMRMPGMSGDELLRVVKDRWPTTIRVVITAFSDIEPILTAINEGLVARYLVKPWERAEVEQLLRWGLEAFTFGRESGALQRRLLETERLATLGSIAGAVVHDLNQPLIGLVMNAERLSELSASAPALLRLLAGGELGDADRAVLHELAEELAELTTDLASGAGHLRNLIAGLGQFLRAQPTDTSGLATDLVPIIRHAMAVCQDIAVRARGLILYEGPAELPAVRVSATELTQVLINLVANAAQALLARGRSDGRVTVLARALDQVVSLQIRDDGVGMAAEILAKVGTPFFTTRREGTGLGLSQCQRLVGKAGGSFKIESEEGVGTVVSLSLPIAIKEID
jgi:signal transduction histidine kinase